MNLSGGQRQRVSLARALYSDRPILLLDDPLSAVDACVGAQIFQKAIMGVAKGRTVLFVTHQLQVNSVIFLSGLIVVKRFGFLKSQSLTSPLSSVDLFSTCLSVTTLF